MGIGKELRVVSLGIVNYRVTRHLILRITHLHPIDADNFVVIRVDISSIRLEHILATNQHTTTRVATNAGLGIVEEIIGIESCRAIDNLYNLGVDLRLVGIAVILGTITIDVGRATIDKDIAEALDMALRIAHRTIGRNYRTVVVSRKVAHYDHNLLAIVKHLPTLIGLHLHIVALLWRGVGRNRRLLLALDSLGCRQRREAIATCKDQACQRYKRYRYGY